MSSILRAGLSEELTLEQRSRLSEEGAIQYLEEESSNSKYKGLEVDLCRPNQKVHANEADGVPQSWLNCWNIILVPCEPGA